MSHGDYRGLALCAGGTEARFSGAVVVDGRATDQGVDPISVGDGVFGAFHHHDASAVGKDRSGGIGGEGPAATIG